MRARNIKPGFFKNDLLGECEPLARLLFQGLWCLADRNGRLEDRPRKIKGEVFPYDNCDIDSLLDQLLKRNFITRYTAEDGTQIIQVEKFLKHQKPHHAEPETLPPKPGKIQAEPGKNQAQPGKIQVEPGKSTNEPGEMALNPSSLNPSSLNGEYSGPEETKKPEEQPNLGIFQPEPAQDKPPPKFEFTPAGVAQEFCFRQHPRKESEFVVAEEIESMVGAGYTLERIRQEVKSRTDFGEFFWQVKQRLEREKQRREREAQRAPPPQYPSSEELHRKIQEQKKHLEQLEGGSDGLRKRTG